MSEKKLQKIRIKPGGEIVAMNTPLVDKIPGHRKVTRASDVEFDETKQKWVAEIRPNIFNLPEKVLIERDTREEAIQAEIEYINNILDQSNFTVSL